MNKLELTDNQLKIVVDALDLYSRIGIGQFDKIKDHPTFESHLNNICRPVKEIEVGDKTPQGEVLEIKNGKALINGSVGKDGFWSEKQKWIKLSDVKLSTDYTKYHAIRDIVDSSLLYPRNRLINDLDMPLHGSWGIHNENVDDSCRIAFDIVQVIRHEKWKLQENKTNMTVDSHIHFTHRKDDSSNKIKCNINV